MRSLSLNRVLDRAVQYALLSTLVACGGRSFESGESSQRANNLDDPENESEPGEPSSEPGPSTPDSPSPTPALPSSEGTNPAQSTPTGLTPTQPPPVPQTPSPATATGTQSPAPTPVQPTLAPPPVEPTPTPTQTPEPPTPPVGKFENLECNQGLAWKLENFALTGEYDHVAVRTVPPFGERTEVASLGQACSGASDPESCEAAVAEAWPTSSEWLFCGQAGCEYDAILTTRGDEVELLTERSALHALLGPIDSLDEAVIWLQMNGHEIRCDAAQVRINGSSYEVKYSAMIADCPVQHAVLLLEVNPDGSITELSRDVQPETGVCVGRRPEGLDALRTSKSGRLVGDFFAEVAQLEEAAVEAFRVIADELAALGAPESLRRAALSAREDEVRHTVQSSQLARRYGVEPLRPVISERPLRSRFEFARDNVVEGCVRETFGAAFAKYQAENARDPEVRHALTGIATDETRHAELSWALHAWIVETLDAAEIAELDRARGEAISTLRRELDVEVAPELCEFAGVPSRTHALALLDALELELWSEPAPLAA